MPGTFAAAVAPEAAAVIPSKMSKLSLYPPNFSSEEVLLHAEDFPWLSIGDVIEVFAADEDGSAPRLLLKLSAGSLTTAPDKPALSTSASGSSAAPRQRDTVYLEKSIGDAFRLANFTSVVVRRVCPESIALDTVEVTFRDQYMGRSEMWRMKLALTNSCVFLGKKVELCQGTLRCQVNEMWRQGVRMACGMVTSDTKVVFRSPTAMIYLFIQMSSEMWDFDAHGNLYFENAVDGFLAEMLERWRAYGASHEVTIVLFSRCFYDSCSKDDFPQDMKSCLFSGYNGRIYEDFYWVVVQNERFDDWTPVLSELRRIFTGYRRSVLDYHRRGADSHRQIPSSRIASAEQGNFLEVLNMSLNTFENHYKNRNLDRTGQQVIVITPGVGIFEVDKELAQMTKQRIINSGVGSDLICVGEQPLHAVPLLRFQEPHKQQQQPASGDPNAQRKIEEYSMPHWINLSFYSSQRNNTGGFRSRIKVPSTVAAAAANNKAFSNSKRPMIKGSLAIIEASKYAEGNPIEMIKFMDAYDEGIFQMPSGLTASSSSVPAGLGALATASTAASAVMPSVTGTADSARGKAQSSQPPPIRRKLSNPELLVGSDEDSMTSGRPTFDKQWQQGFQPQKSLARNSDRQSLHKQLQVSSRLSERPTLSASYKEPSTFGSHMRNLAASSKTSEANGAGSNGGVTGFERLDCNIVGSSDGTFDHRAIKTYLLGPGRALVNPFDPRQTTVRMTSSRRRWTHIFPPGPTTSAAALMHQHLVPNKHAVPQLPPMKEEEEDMFLFGATDPERSSFAGSSSGVTTGVDWKSLTIPASLPITTDYFPNRQSFLSDYVVNEYSITPEEINADRSQLAKPALSNDQIFAEVVSQRLAQGFQIILMPDEDDPCVEFEALANNSTAVDTVDGPTKSILDQVFWLSIGNIFHRVSFDKTLRRIKVIKYRPKHSAQSYAMHYRYRFRAPDNDTFEVSWVGFHMEKLENYNWNHVDYYVCTRGETEYALTDAHKFWRVRMLMVPLVNYQQINKKIMESIAATSANLVSMSTSAPALALTSTGSLASVGSSSSTASLASSVKSTIPPAVCLAVAAGHCDVYDSVQTTSWDGVEGFSRFVDNCLNRLRKCPKPSQSDCCRLCCKMDSTGSSGTTPVLVAASPKTVAALALSRSHTGGTPAGSLPSAASSPNLLHQQPQPPIPAQALTRSASVVPSFLDLSHVSVSDVVEAMRSPCCGVPLVAKATGLSRLTFLSTEAVIWVQNKVRRDADVASTLSLFDSISLLSSIVSSGVLIRHASGSEDVPFRYGTFLYTFVVPGEEFPWGNLEDFQNDWAEVEIYLPILASVPSVSIKSMMVSELDQVYRSDRPEWGHARYHSLYEPYAAFELSLEWTIGTGAVITELVLGWARKAQQCGFSLFPVPADAFALPVTRNSDPVRGPIFVELALSSLSDCSACPSPSSMTEHSLLRFREAVARRFGFVRCHSVSVSGHGHGHADQDALFSTDHQYLHCTGNMFLLIPTKLLQPQTGIQGIRARPSSSMDLRQESTAVSTVADGEEDDANMPYINRHISEPQPTYDHSSAGFLWSWNFMISRRWKQLSNTGATGDIPFMDRMFADFRAFCSNKDGRLDTFWNEFCLENSIMTASDVSNSEVILIGQEV